MKVFLAAVADYLSDQMVECLSAFMDFCYLVRPNDITENTLDEIDTALARFHDLCTIYVETGVCTTSGKHTIFLSHQHSLVHYRPHITEFGAPNGLCSSITESRHITAVKKS